MIKKTRILLSLSIFGVFTMQAMDPNEGEKLAYEELQRSFADSLEQRDISQIKRICKKNIININQPIQLLHIDSKLVSTKSYVPPLIWAAREQHLDVMKVLCKNGAEVNREYMGATALQTSIANGFIDAIPVLFDHKAQQTLIPIFGYNLLHLAVKNHACEKLIAMLVYLGGKEQLSKKDNINKQTPFELAQSMGSPATILLSNPTLLDAKIEEVRKELEAQQHANN